MIKFELIQGTVEIIDWKKLCRELARNKMEIDTSVDFHYTFICDKKARCTLMFQDNSKIFLGSNSEFTLTNDKLKALLHPSFKGKTSIKLLCGKAWSIVSSLTGDDTSFKIETSNAVAGVRG